MFRSMTINRELAIEPV